MSAKTKREMTDAELLENLARQWDGLPGPKGYRLWDMAKDDAIRRGREYLRGVRAMPDTPASNADSKGGEE